MKLASFILPPVANDDRLSICLDSLLSQDRGNLEVLLLQDRRSVSGGQKSALRHQRVVRVTADGEAESLPHLLNRAVSRARGDAVFFVAECVEFAPGFLDTYLDRLFGRSGGGWAYGRFYESGDSDTPRLRDVRTSGSDLSEGSQIGPVRAVRRDCLEAAGLYDTDFAYAFEYDLRLRILEQFDAVRIDEPLYNVHAQTVHADTDRPATLIRQLEHYRCYVRSGGASPARSYLDYLASEEGEFRAACRRTLRQRGALLEGPARPLECPHTASATPHVTVIIPLWNREETIGPALESVLQSRGCDDYEVLVIDNGSSDRSVSIVEEYQNHGSVRLIHHPSNNIAGALNAGIRASSGKYVCQLDSDDLYTPDTLRLLLAYMERHPDSALGVSYYDCIGPDGAPLPGKGVVKHLEYDRNNLMRTDGLGAARIWHRCVLERLGGFDERLGNYAEDYDLQLKLTEHYEVLRIPHVLYHYRMGHKKAGETIDYSERHRKKTAARRAALERRRQMIACT